MVWLGRVLCSAAVLALLGAGARAADMPGYPVEPLPTPKYVPPPVVEETGGWYLRGDLGYAWGMMDDAVTSAPYPDPSSSTLGNGFTGDLGVGYKSQWLRTDFTIGYTSPLKYTGTVATPDDTTAKIEAVTLLFNGYFDLGTWHHITPYIGASAGASAVRTFDYASTAAPPFTPDLSYTHWQFTWALTGGLAYAISPNLSFDVNYRYINFGDVTTASDSFGDTTFKNVYAHEVRVGIRWSFDDQAF